MAKPNPDKVIEDWAIVALSNAKDIQSAYSHYVICSYRSTGKLASGCDAKDLIAWYKVNMLDEYKAKGGK